jgi:hypothetical protein
MNINGLNSYKDHLKKAQEAVEGHDINSQLLKAGDTMIKNHDAGDRDVIDWMGDNAEKGIRYGVGKAKGLYNSIKNRFSGDNEGPGVQAYRDAVGATQPEPPRGGGGLLAGLSVGRSPEPPPDQPAVLTVPEIVQPVATPSALPVPTPNTSPMDIYDELADARHLVTRG